MSELTRAQYVEILEEGNRRFGIGLGDTSWQEFIAQLAYAAGAAADRAVPRDVDTPEINDFIDGVKIEAAHQIKRWGYAHDRSKSAENWFWLVGYLAGKALRSAITGDRDKARHHTISSAAALFNWHTAITYDVTGAGIGQDDDLRVSNPLDAAAADAANGKMPDAAPQERQESEPLKVTLTAKDGHKIDVFPERQAQPVASRCELKGGTCQYSWGCEHKCLGIHRIWPGDYKMDDMRLWCGPNFRNDPPREPGTGHE